MDSSHAKKASEILARFFDEKTMGEISQFQSFRSSWKQIVGERIADHSRPMSVIRHTLLVAADHSGWIQLLQMNQERILERIARAYPELNITSLAFTVCDDALPQQGQRGAAAAVQPGEEHPEPSASTEKPHSGQPASLPPALEEIFQRMRREQGN